MCETTTIYYCKLSSLQVRYEALNALGIINSLAGTDSGSVVEFSNSECGRSDNDNSSCDTQIPGSELSDLEKEAKMPVSKLTGLRGKIERTYYIDEEESDIGVHNLSSSEEMEEERKKKRKQQCPLPNCPSV